MKKRINILLCFIMICIMGSSFSAFAAEKKEVKANDPASPIDVERQIPPISMEESILIPSTIAQERASFPHTIKGTIVGDGVRLRSNPSDSAAVLEVMYSGERVWVDESQDFGDWYRVTRISTGRTGYVYWEYCQPDFQR